MELNIAQVNVIMQIRSRLFSNRHCFVYKQSCCSRLRLEQQLMNEICFEIKYQTLSLPSVLCLLKTNLFDI